MSKENTCTRGKPQLPVYNTYNLIEYPCRGLPRQRNDEGR